MSENELAYMVDPSAVINISKLSSSVIILFSGNLKLVDTYELYIYIYIYIISGSMRYC